MKYNRRCQQVDIGNKAEIRYFNGNKNNAYKTNNTNSITKNTINNTNTTNTNLNTNIISNTNI